MNNKVIRFLEMFIRVRQFCAAHAGSFPADSRGGELLALIVSIIKEMQEHASAQDSGHRSAKERTALKKVALKRLREDLEAVSRTARAMAFTVPGLGDKFHLPKTSSAQAWLTAARSIAGDAEPLKAEFVRRGLAASFLEDLNAHIAALEESINSKAEKTGARVAATVAVSEAAERGRRAVRELDAIVRNIFRDDPATLAEWESASHVERAAQPRRRKVSCTTRARGRVRNYLTGMDESKDEGGRMKDESAAAASMLSLHPCGLHPASFILALVHPF